MKIISTQRHSQFRHQDSKAREQEAGRVLRQTARPFYFPFVCERARRKNASFMHDSYLCPCLRHVFYAISRSLMKSLTAGSGRNAPIRSQTPYRRGVQITTGACGRRCDHKGPADSGHRESKAARNGEGENESAKAKSLRPVRWMDANRRFGISPLTGFSNVFQPAVGRTAATGPEHELARTQWTSWMMQRCAAAVDAGGLSPIGATY